MIQTKYTAYHYSLSTAKTSEYSQHHPKKQVDNFTAFRSVTRPSPRPTMGGPRLPPSRPFPSGLSPSINDREGGYQVRRDGNSRPKFTFCAAVGLRAGTVLLTAVGVLSAAAIALPGRDGVRRMPRGGVP